MKKTSKKEKKRLIFISFVIVGLLGYLVASVYSDWKEIINNNNKIVALNKEYSDLMDNEKSLQSEVAKLKDPDYVARYAKEKYLYSSDGDTIIRMDDNQ